MKRTYLFLSLILTTGLFTSCKRKEIVDVGPKKYCISDTMAKMITIDTATSSNITNEITLSGEVSFNENSVIKIFPRSSGQVLEVKVSFGDKVQKGQVLAVIRSADVAGSYSDLSTTGADIAIAKRQMENAESLFKNGIASEREFTEAKQNYQKALVARAKIQSTLNINGGSRTSPGGTYVLTSPISGYIVEKKVNAGSFIRQDMSDNLFTISNMKDVWVMANVFEADIPKVKEGYPVKVTTLAYPDKVFVGKVDKVSEVLDPENKALKVRIKLDNPGMMLKPEMFTKVIVTNEEDNKATAIPSDAIVEESGKTYVIVYNSDCDLKVQEVDVLKEAGDITFIHSGVNPGQKLIGKNALLLYDEFTDNE
ncbi:MAG: Co/Zn/Cd efflux system rane fusion protein [Segetibacter sp.]|nr:Co/Zn/Cd efflux system rane fusion protein [Segetibacter sp.]